MDRQLPLRGYVGHFLMLSIGCLYNQWLADVHLTTQVKVDGPVRPRVQMRPLRACFSIPQYIDISRLENP